MSLSNDDMEAISDIGGEFAPADNNGMGTATFDENFEFDSSGTSEEELQAGGDAIDKEGWYHFEISKVDFKLELLDDNGQPQTPHINVTCRSLADGNGLSPAGSPFWHKIYVAQKDGSIAKQGSIDSMFRFGIGCGLYKWAKVKTEGGSEKAVPVLAKTGLTKIPMAAWKDAVGLQFCARLTREKDYVDKNGVTKPGKLSIPMGRTYRPDHPDVSHVAKNLEALEAIGIVIPANGEKSPPSSAEKKGAASATSTTKKPVQQQQQKEQELVSAGVSGDSSGDPGFDMSDF